MEHSEAGSLGEAVAPPEQGSSAEDRATPIPTITLMGWPLAAITEQQSVEHILDQLDQGHGGWVVTPNLDHLRRLVRDRSFAELCRPATLLVPDGMPLIWASRLQRTPLPERVAGSSLVSTLSEEAARRGRSIFLLGGDPGTAEGAGEALCRRYQGLKIAGTHCPIMGFEKDEQEIGKIADILKQASPDIVYVALGSPKQEWLISQLQEQLPNAWWMGVGISFSYLCGSVKRAPRWARKTGLEWCFRLFQEPRRLIKRYLWEDLPFGVFLLVKAAIRGLLGGR